MGQFGVFLPPNPSLSKQLLYGSETRCITKISLKARVILSMHYSSSGSNHITSKSEDEKRTHIEGLMGSEKADREQEEMTPSILLEEAGFVVGK